MPVDTVFDSIEDLADLAEHAHSPFSPQQMMNLAYVLFSKEPILQQDLVRTWFRKPPLDKTWATMMVHFHDAQKDLHSLPTARDLFHQVLGPHQANSTRTQHLFTLQSVLQAIKIAGENVAAVIVIHITWSSIFSQKAKY
jgi:hypothetical protein